MLPTKRHQNWLPSIFNDILGSEWLTKSSATSPALNIIESGNEYRVELAAPGIGKDDFRVEINNDGGLVISMAKSDKRSTTDEKYLRRDFSFSQFQQTLILPDNIDRDNIEAEHINGVLTVILHKKETVDIAPAKSVSIK